MKYKKEIKKLGNSFKYAFSGIYASFKSERNMKIHFIIMLIVIILGIILKIKVSEWAICLILFGIVIAGELFNTAIETVVDMITLDKNPLAKKTKDISAGAVLVLAIIAFIIGIIIFIPKIISLL